MSDKVMVVFSGGQDSTTCLYWAKKTFGEVRAVTFNYGQNHAIELECAKRIANMAMVRHDVVDLTALTPHLSGAMLKNSVVNIPEQCTEGIAPTFVPGRNLIFGSIAFAMAYAEGTKNIVLGINQTDYSGYPDCRQTFLDSLTTTVQEAVDDHGVYLFAPLLYLTKAQTFGLAEELGCLNIILENTHTCYRGDHTTKNEWGFGCGKCPACNLREKGWNEYKGSKKS